MKLFYNTALNTFSRIPECLAIGEKELDLPPMQQGGMWVLTFSMFSWSSAHILLLDELSKRLVRENLFVGQHGKTLYGEVLRIQKSQSEALLNILYEAAFKDMELKSLWELQIIGNISSLFNCRFIYNKSVNFNFIISDGLLTIISPAVPWSSIMMSSSPVKGKQTINHSITHSTYSSWLLAL